MTQRKKSASMTLTKILLKRNYESLTVIPLQLHKSISSLLMMHRMTITLPLGEPMLILLQMTTFLILF